MPPGERFDARRRKLDEAFSGRQFVIESEVHLPYGKVYRNPFGNTGRHGYIIRDVASGNRYVVGRQLLQLIHDRYQGVTLPENRPRLSDRQP